MAKNKTTVNICGKTYNLVSDDPVEYMRRVAFYAEDLIKRTGSEYAGFNSAMTSMLALLNLADEHIRQTEELENIKRELSGNRELIARLEAEVLDAAGDSRRLAQSRSDVETEIASLKQQLAALELENSELRRNSDYVGTSRLKEIG